MATEIITMKTALFLVLFGLITLAAAQNDTCSPENSVFEMSVFQHIARRAVENYIAGEAYDAVGIQTHTETFEPLKEDDMKYLKPFLMMQDPYKIRRSPYHKMFETGKVPEGIENLKFESIIEQQAMEVINKIQGPAKMILDLLRDHPELKYKPEKVKVLLKDRFEDNNELQNHHSQIEKNNVVDISDAEDHLQQCQADINYLYNPVLETLSCQISNLINGIIQDILPECKLCLNGSLCAPWYFCLNVTAPSRPVPGVSGAFIDAQFKIPPGLSQGNLHWVGSYDQCVRIRDVTYDSSLVGMDPAETRTFKPHYCRIEVRAGYSENETGSGLPLFLGVCVPDSCAAPEVTAYLTVDSKFLGMKVVDIFCGGDPVNYEENSMAMATVVIFIVILIVVGLATLYDMLIRKQLLVVKLRKMDLYINTIGRASSINSLPDFVAPQVNADPSTEPGETRQQHGGAVQRPVSYVSQVSTVSNSDLLENELGASKLDGNSSPLDEKPTLLERLEGMFVAFSAHSNVKRIFDTSNTQDRLLSCDSVRLISVVWCTFGLTWLFGTLYSEAWTTANLLPVITTTTRTFLFQFVINFTFSADSAFVVAGCVLTYNWMKDYEKTKKLTWTTFVYHFLHRYVRLAVPLILALIAYTLISQVVIESGPLVPPGIEDAKTCQSQWYINMFLLHNLISNEEMCLSWTFHVAMVFQFHLVAPIILVPLVWKPKLGALVGVLVYLAHLIVLGIMAGNMVDGGGFGVWYMDILLAPWCRAGPYLVGMFVGYAVFRHKQTPYNVPYIARVIIWLCAMACLMAPIFSTYDVLSEGAEWNRAQRINYQLWSRTAFGLGVGWLILSSEIGVGGFPGRFLRYRQWVPLSKLSYMTLLVGAMFIFQNVYSQMEPIIITGYIMTCFFLGNMTMSILVAALLALLCQYPFYEMENALFSKSKLHIIKLGRNPLNDMVKSQNIAPISRSYSSAQEVVEDTPPSGLQEKPQVDLHRTISHTSQL